MDKQQTGNGQAPKNGRRRPSLYVAAVALICVLVVLILSNLSAILRPFQTLNSILAPITIGLIVAYLANPLLRLFEYKVFFRLKSRRANRALSLFFTYLVIFAMLAGVIWLIVPQVIESVNDLRINGTTYINNIITSLNRIITAIPFLEGNPDNLLSLEKLLNMILRWLNDYSISLIGGIGTVASGIITVLKNILVGFFISLYVLLAKDRLNAGCRRIFRALLSPKKEALLLYYTRQAHRKFGGFFIGKIIDSIIIGLLSGVLFSIFKIPYAMLIAVIVGVTNVIPFFGPFIGAIPSAMIIFIKDPMKALLFCILILAIQQFDGNVLGPLILGESTGISSLGILVSITVASGLFGFAGMLIGVPLFALLTVMAEDYLKYKLHKKGHSVRLRDYYPADAFLLPDDTEEEPKNKKQRFSNWVLSVEREVACKDYTPSIHHSIGRGVRFTLLFTGRLLHILPRKAAQDATGTTVCGAHPDTVENVPILPQEPEPLILPEEPAPDALPFSDPLKEAAPDDTQAPAENESTLPAPATQNNDKQGGNHG